MDLQFVAVCISLLLVLGHYPAVVVNQSLNQLPGQPPDQKLAQPPDQKLAQPPIQMPNKLPVHSADHLAQMPNDSPAQLPLLNPSETPNQTAEQVLNQTPEQSLNQPPGQVLNEPAVQVVNQPPVNAPTQISGVGPNQLPVKKPNPLPGQGLNHQPVHVSKQISGIEPSHLPVKNPNQLPGQGLNRQPVNIPNQIADTGPNQLPVIEVNKHLGQKPNQSLVGNLSQPLGQASNQLGGQEPKLPIVVPNHVPGQGPNNPSMNMPNHSFANVPNTGWFVADITATNYKGLLYGSNSAWVLEFYNFDCGSCMQFQEYYERVAERTQKWKEIIRFGRIECKNEFNLELCRMFRSDLVPSILLLPFGVNDAYLVSNTTAPQTFKNQSFNRVAENLPNLMVDFLTQYPGNNTLQLDILENLNVNNVWEVAPIPSKRLAIVFEGSDSYLGRKVILGTLYLRNCVTVMRANSANAMTNSEKHKTYLGLFDQHHGMLKIEPAAESVEEYIQAIEKWLRTQNCDFIRPRKIKLRTGGLPIIQPVSVNINLDMVYLRDFENTLYEFFFIELAYKATVDQKMLSVLNAFIVCLFKYLPLRVELKLFLEELNDYLDEEKEGLSYDQMRNKLLELQKDNMNPLGHNQWMGCQGSQLHMRRYPCGLWTIFHTLTVNAFLVNKMESDFDILEVLLAIREFVLNFYSCSDCVIHFTQMSRNLESEVNSREWSVLWLWQVHNKINKRMANDTLSNDPIHPKTQFPSPHLCPNCQRACVGPSQHCSEPTWDQDAVLSFLLSYYSEETFHLNNKQDQKAVEEEQRRLDAILNKEFVTVGGSPRTRRRRQLASGTHIKDAALRTYTILPTLWIIYICVLILVFSFFVIARMCIRSMLPYNVNQ